MIYYVGADYYTIDELYNTIAGSIAINDNNQAYMVAENAQSVDLSGASDIANILKLKSSNPSCCLLQAIRGYRWIRVRRKRTYDFPSLGW